MFIYFYDYSELYLWIEVTKALLVQLVHEKFVAILPNTDEDGAKKLASSINLELAQLNIRHESSPSQHITMSQGIATVKPTLSLQPTDLFEAANSNFSSLKDDYQSL